MKVIYIQKNTRKIVKSVKQPAKMADQFFIDEVKKAKKKLMNETLTNFSKFYEIKLVDDFGDVVNLDVE